MIPQEIVRRIENLPESRHGVLVALSGGLDSTALAHILAAGSFPMATAHIHHGLRDCAAIDAEASQRLARSLGVFHREVNISVHKRNSTQMQARTQRYAALASLVSELGFGLLVTAHHLDDQLESLELADRRNAAFHPLQITSYMIDFGVHVARPIHDVRRDSILAYAQDNELSWAEDPTNADPIYLRNQIRQELTNDQKQELMTRFLEAPMKTQINIERLSARTHRAALHDLSAEFSDGWRSLTQRLPGASVNPAQITALMSNPEHNKVDATGCTLTADGQFVTASTASTSETTPGVIDGDSGEMPWFGSICRWSSKSKSKHRAEPGFKISGPRPGEKFTRSDGRVVEIREVLRAARVPGSERWRWPCLRDANEKCVAIVGISDNTPASGSVGVWIEPPVRGGDHQFWDESIL